MGRLYSLITILFLATFVFINGCHADQALIDSVCKDSHDFSFCSSMFLDDPRSGTADLHGLALIAISNTNLQIQDTVGRIPGILSQLRDRLGKKRLRVCQYDYNYSLKKYQGAFESTSRNAYWDTLNYVQDGYNSVVDCHNIYRRNGPIANSPIAGDDTNVFKLTEIILIVINRLIAH